MRPFSYHPLRSVRDLGGLQAITSSDSFIAGGTTLFDLMKLNVMHPERVIDLRALANVAEFARVGEVDGALYLGALARMADVAADEHVLRNYPVIRQTLDFAASQQIRNMASLGGNVLQRTRCPYFRDTSWSACNKRAPGSGCAASGGFNRMHAVLGTSAKCIATYPGDFGQALIALDADVVIISPRGSRTIKFSGLHVEPEDDPATETVLAPDELIQAFRVPAGPWTRCSAYVKVRDRESYEFALASAAVALDLDANVVREVRIALGGVATVPWRARRAEAALSGQHLDEAAAKTAAEIAFADAQPSEHNAFKIDLGKATLVRALLETQAMEL
jgi:xanthine dehydrogenase YagS FAD-binding subunit